VIVILACFACITVILSSDRREDLRVLDLMVAIPFLALVTLPIFPMSWLAVTGLSFYILLFANGNSERTRAAVDPARAHGPDVVEPLCCFQFFAKTILDIDATLVASLLGTTQTGNMVQFADGFGLHGGVCRAVLRSPTCRFAFLCWVAITQWGAASVDGEGFCFLVRACLRIGDRGQRHADQF